MSGRCSEPVGRGTGCSGSRGDGPKCRKESVMTNGGLGIRRTAIALVLASLACSTTTFESTWRAPDARPLRLSGRKVVAMFLSKNAARRRRAEDALAREISARGAQGVPAYAVLSDAEVQDQDAAKAKLE